MRQDVLLTLKKVRSIAKIFKRSPLKNSVLQKYVLQQEGKELILPLDCKTRWNSIIPMLRRFTILKNCILSALNDLDHKNLCDDTLFDVCSELLQTIEPFEISIHELSKENANLLTAEGTIIFLVQHLSKKSGLASDLMRSLLKRINERRNSVLITLLSFLKTHSLPQENGYFKYSSKKVITEYANQICNRLFDRPTGTSLDIIETLETPSTSLNEELQRNISKFCEKKFQDGQKVDSMKNHLKILETTGTMSEDLRVLKDALMSIRPTSTSSERVFSVAGHFNSKTRSKMGPNTLNAPIFLKYYFLNTK